MEKKINLLEKKQKKLNFAIVISRYYLSRCVCLINSLTEYNHKIYILCYDKESFVTLNKIKNINIKLFEFSKIKKFDKEFNKKIKKRELIDQIVTSRPIFINFLRKKLFLKHIFLLDSDLYFFSNPLKLKEIIQKKSVAFTRHNFVQKKLFLNKMYGLFNGGFVYIKFDKNGINFLKKWSALCKEWCEFKPDEGKFSDQKYLEILYKKINNTYAINHPGVNLAPWNLENKKIKKIKNEIYVNSSKLIFYHFHGVRLLWKNIFILGLSNYHFMVSNDVKKLLYKNYLDKLINTRLTNEYFKKKINIYTVFKKIPLLIKKLIFNDYYIY